MHDDLIRAMREAVTRAAAPFASLSFAEGGAEAAKESILFVSISITTHPPGQDFSERKNALNLSQIAADLDATIGIQAAPDYFVVIAGTVGDHRFRVVISLE